jgi:hypothetical protein
MKNIKLTLFAATAIILTLIACKKIQPDFDVAATDPCDCASEVSADFDIIEEMSNGLSPELNTYTITDDILEKSRAYFRAKEKEAQYTWYIGIDSLYDKEVNRFFEEQWAGFDIPITLVVKKEPNLNCFPNDDGYDSITKIMRVHSFCDTSIMEGTFRVAGENSTDSFDIVLDIEEVWIAPGVIESGACARLDFYNYDGNSSNCIGYNLRLNRNYREFKRTAFDQNGGDPNDCGRLALSKCELKTDGLFIINYGTKFGSNETRYNMKGRKLN